MFVCLFDMIWGVCLLGCLLYCGVKVFVCVGVGVFVCLFDRNFGVAAQE